MFRASRWHRKLTLAGALTFAAGLAGGCANPRAVAAFWNRDAAELDAEQVVDLMRQARFRNEQIIRLGPDLRNALALYGGAKIMAGDTTEAIMVVHGRAIYVAVRKGPNLIYELPPPPPEDVEQGPDRRPAAKDE